MIYAKNRKHQKPRAKDSASDRTDGIWQPAPEKLNLGATDIHVWRVHLTPALLHEHTLIALLSREERNRRERLHHAGVRQFFTVGRGVLRLLVGKYLGLPPENLPLARTRAGKPYLADIPGYPAVSFNLSHSGAWVVLAFGVDRPIGIDLEYRDERTRVTELAERFFAPEEQFLVLETGVELRHQVFYDLWVKKEAYLKALGTGLRRSLRTFTVPAPASDIPALFYPNHLASTAIEDRQAWMIYRFSVAPSYASALVTSPAPCTIRHFDWPP